MFSFLRAIFGSAQERKVRQYRKIVKEINAIEEKLQSLPDESIKTKTDEFRKRLSQGETLDQILPEAYAVIKNVCRRLIGADVHVSGYDQKWDMIPYDVQMIGAIGMHQGNIAEMMTGEGKTLTAVMPLYLNALTGRPVHLVTVNDYLADRDCQWVGSILRWLGLTTGALLGSTPTHQRKEIYTCDVVYGTSSEFGFDYLRDNSMSMRAEDQVQRGFYFAIIDEVDSILIDEARTPLIISGPSPHSFQMYEELKDGVAKLVRLQRDECTSLANAAKKGIEATTLQEGEKLTKEQREERDIAFRNLWKVSKGMPNNRILKRIKEDPDQRAELDKMDLYYYGDQNKEERHEALAELYIIVDERASEYELTDKGIAAWEKCSTNDIKGDAFTMIDISDEYVKIDSDSSLSEEERMEKKLKVQEEDAKRKEISHNLRQLLRAHLLMENDIDYMVQDGKIIIIDENTGRAQPGRRFSDGLHQAIEAKEGVKIEAETQTYATVTLQNYFRMYDKLSGMTGTAMTEAGEFKEIYKLDVLEIPTHKKCIRKDEHDEIYMTEREKYNAILQDVREVHEQGRPILLGTESVEVSEKLSRIFRANNIPHTVLNAKFHAKEAEIVAQAGQRGAVTISTNMAGRGTDIKLGNGVADLGGLYVMGTTRHQSRRIDRQLRGRCARQGDPGNSKFYISFEDQLLRLFASPKMTAVLQRFRPPEGEPISSKYLNKSIETAQKRVEQRNYTIRKHTLEYDDVMNMQRHSIYDFRNEILHEADLVSLASGLIEDVIHSAAASYFVSRSVVEGWNPEGFRQWLMEHFPISFEEGEFDDDLSQTDELAEKAAQKVLESFHTTIETKRERIESLEEQGLIGKGSLDYILRDIMTRKLDNFWKDHLLAMDHLRTEVTLRQVGQRDPLLEFKKEAFELFDELTHNLREEISQVLFKFEVKMPSHQDIEVALKKLQLETNRNFIQEAEPTQQQAPNGAIPSSTTVMSRPQQEAPKLEPITVGPKTGRNDPCPCGSGKKYKQCCGK